MRLLLDTHVLLWASAAPERLSVAVARHLQDPRNELHVSLASWWEIAIKAGKPRGGLTLPERWEEETKQYMAEWNLHWLPIRTEHCRAVRHLPWKGHRDPFDRMLIAQAQIEHLGLVSIDREFRAYEIKVVW